MMQPVIIQVTGYTASSVWKVGDMTNTVYTHTKRNRQEPTSVTIAGSMDIPMPRNAAPLTS